MDGIRWIEIVIQLCRLQVQREREKLAMTPKMRGVLESLKKLKHHGDEQSEKLTRRIEDEVMPKLNDGFARAHKTVDEVVGIVDGIDEFAEGLKGSNGGPLDNSGEQSEKHVPPRSSEVASR